MFQSLSFLLHQDWVDVLSAMSTEPTAGRYGVDSLSRAKKATCPFQCSLCLTILPPLTTTLNFPLAEVSCLVSFFHSIHVGHKAGPFPVWRKALSSPRRELPSWAHKCSLNLNGNSLWGQGHSQEVIKPDPRLGAASGSFPKLLLY